MQASHTGCEAFWRMVYGSMAFVHQRCVNPRHITMEPVAINSKRARCNWLSEDGATCECGLLPTCLPFMGSQYYAQLAAVAQLLKRQPHVVDPRLKLFPHPGEFTVPEQPGVLARKRSQ